MPAIDRYTGVLFDALDAPTPRRRRARVRARAPWSCTRRCSVSSGRSTRSRRIGCRTIPGFPASALRRVLARAARGGAGVGSPGVILDLRSEGYAELGPAPARARQRVRAGRLGRRVDGRRRALNHFNKHAKGLFTRAFLRVPTARSTRSKSCIDWAREPGFRLDLREPPRRRRAASSSSSSPDAAAAPRCVSPTRRRQAGSDRSPADRPPGSIRRGGRRPCPPPA